MGIGIRQWEGGHRIDGAVGRDTFTVFYNSKGSAIGGQFFPGADKPPPVSAPQGNPVPVHPKPTLYQLLTGSWGILKAKFGIKVVKDEVYKVRRQTCLACPLYDFGVCGSPKQKCGCYLAATIRLKSESCPEGLW